MQPCYHWSARPYGYFSGQGDTNVINGVVVEEIFQLIIVLLVLTFVLGGIYLMQKYTGV